jgi:hypothetical protein
MEDQLAAKPLLPRRTKQIQNKHIQTSMPPVGFEARTPVFERVEARHTSDRAVTVIGALMALLMLNCKGSDLGSLPLFPCKA